MNPWMPIETAPKDVIIDVWLGDASAEDAYFYCTKGTRRSPAWKWSEGKFRPQGGLVLLVFVTPTHWMPLPVAPV